MTPPKEPQFSLGETISFTQPPVLAGQVLGRSHSWESCRLRLGPSACLPPLMPPHAMNSPALQQQLSDVASTLTLTSDLSCNILGPESNRTGDPKLEHLEGL